MYFAKQVIFVTKTQKKERKKKEVFNKCMWENFENHKIVQHPLHEISTMVIPKQWKTLSPSSGFAIHIYELKTGIFIKKNLIYYNKNPGFQ